MEQSNNLKFHGGMAVALVPVVIYAACCIVLIVKVVLGFCIKKLKTKLLTNKNTISTEYKK